MRKIYALLFSFTAVLVFATSAHAGFVGNIQAQAAFSGYNDVRIPGDTGTSLSLTDDLDADTAFSPRVEAGWLFGDRHYAGLMATLLRVKSTGRLERNTTFDKTTFSAGDNVEARYRFDSYRATYRYYFIRGEKLRLGAGLSAKIRDAAISIEGGGQEEEYTNTGFVPLINFSLEWKAWDRISFLLYGDFLGSKQGRAEDIFAGALCDLNDTVSIMAGYRILEGGADNDTVYTFALVHYAVAGVQIRL